MKTAIQEQTIGFELEMTGITRKQAALVLKNYFDEQAGNAISYIEPISTWGHTGYTVTEWNGRKWSLKYDGTIQSHSRTAPGRKMQPTNAGEWKTELTSPVLEYKDIPMLQEIIRALFKAGGRSDAKYGCGIHVHIGANKHDARSIRNLISIMASKEDMLMDALQVSDARQRTYAQKAKPATIQALRASLPAHLLDIKNILDRTDTDRYHAINISALWKHGTVEFRLFNGTMHAGKCKGYIQLALAISAQAINQKRATATKTTTTNPAYTFRTWLLRLGMNGEEYKSARGHLLKELEGDVAFRHGRSA